MSSQSDVTKPHMFRRRRPKRILFTKVYNFQGFVVFRVSYFSWGVQEAPSPIWELCVCIGEGERVEIPPKEKCQCAYLVFCL